MDSDDDDIFSYTPLPRYRSLSQSTPSQKQQKSRQYPGSQQVISKNKKSKVSKVNGTNVFKTPVSKKFKKEAITLETEVCPVCQMPWSILGLNGRRQIHTEKCTEVNFSNLPACPKQQNCQECFERHYMLYNHLKWAEARAGIENPTIQSRGRVSPNDSGFGEAVAGPSGYKAEVVIKDEVIICDSSGSVSEKKCQSVKIFDLSEEFIYEDSLPDLSQSQKKIKSSQYVPDTTKCDVKFEDVPGNIMDGTFQDDSENIIVTFEDVPKNIKPEVDYDDVPDLDLYSIGRVGVKETARCDVKSSSDTGDSETLPANSDTVSFNRQRSCAGSPVNISRRGSNETLMFESHDKNIVDKFAQNTSGIAVPVIASSEKCENYISTIISDDATRSSDQSQSLLRNRDLSYEVTSGVEDSNRGSSHRVVSLPKPVSDEDDEAQSDDEDVLDDLIDQAVEKYVGKMQENSKCFHLHIHYEGAQKSGSQKSILNYFKPLNPKGPVEEENTPKCSTSRGCSGTSGMHKVAESKKSGKKDWKSLMQKMQNNSRQQSTNKESASRQQHSNQQGSAYSGKRTCPFYKYVQDTSFVVDAFSYGYLNGISGYFLSHFHYDHFQGLTKKFNQPIYCSEITGNLVKLRIGVDQQFVRTIPMDTPIVIDNVEVTLLEANHCPGSVMFLFKLTTGLTVLHVGDFRAHPKMESYPALWNCNIDVLYLDTTYCNPVYDFPRQEEILDKCVSIATHHVSSNPKTLIVVGSYTIGKERVFRAIAIALNSKIWASGDKQRILRCIEDEEITSRLTTDKSARIHVVAMKDIHPQRLANYLNSNAFYNKVVAIRPTGWEHTRESGNSLDSFTPKQYGNVYIYGIPYSEHSSYNELRRFVKFSQPKKIIPTVNVGNAHTRKKMELEFSNWLRQ